MQKELREGRGLLQLDMGQLIFQWMLSGREEHGWFLRINQRSVG